MNVISHATDGFRHKVEGPCRATEESMEPVAPRLRNQRARLQVLNRGTVIEVAAACGTLGRILRKLAKADDVAVLRGHEGAAAAAYWPALARLCEAHVGRFTRQRPAHDPLNAAINYLTGMLSGDIRAAVLAAGLHPGFGVLHQPADGHQACIWDLMEGFRALLTEGLAVGAIAESW